MTPHSHRYLPICVLGLLLAACTQATPPQSQNGNQATHQPLMLDCADSGSQRVCVGERGLILQSTDDGQWQPVASPASRLLTAVHFVDADRGWAVGHDGLILHSDDGGLHWRLQHQQIEEDRPLFDVRFSDRQHGFAVGAFGTVLQTRDGGISWQRRELTADEPHLYGIAGEGRTLLIAGEFGTLLRSGDGGLNWQTAASNAGASLFGILALGEGHWLAYGLNGRLLRSDDDGTSWQQTQLSQPATIQTGATGTGDTVWLGSTSGQLWLSRDRGAHFRRAGRSDNGLTLLLPGGDGLLTGGRFGLRALRPETADGADND